MGWLVGWVPKCVKFPPICVCCGPKFGFGKEVFGIGSIDVRNISGMKTNKDPSISSHNYATLTLSKKLVRIGHHLKIKPFQSSTRFPGNDTIH